jgi:hypothetical protein
MLCLTTSSIIGHSKSSNGSECLQEKLRLRSDVRLLLRLRYSILRITVAAGFRVFEIKTSHLSYRFLASGERAAPAALT